MHLTLGLITFGPIVFLLPLVVGVIAACAFRLTGEVETLRGAVGSGLFTLGVMAVVLLFLLMSACFYSTFGGAPEGAHALDDGAYVARQSAMPKETRGEYDITVVKKGKLSHVYIPVEETTVRAGRSTRLDIRTTTTFGGDTPFISVGETRTTYTLTLADVPATAFVPAGK